MESPQNPTVAKESLVTGISRSGRVRKKSSKLLDFQSPDEVDKKPKRLGRPGRPSGTRGRLPGANNIRGRRSFNEIGEDEGGDVDGDADVDDLFGNLDADDLAADVHLAGTIVAQDSDDELDELVLDLVEGVEAETFDHQGAGNNESKVRHSLYMTEKANKRKILKDGKVITGKLERKDKGKSRYTAYSMWAREFRKTSKFSKNQDLDFSNAARRLGELWANVSTKEKNAWRRKAKIQATKAKSREKAIEATAPVGRPANFNASFLNRATTSRTKKLAADQQQQVALETAKGQQTVLKNQPIQQRRKRYNSHKSTNNTFTPTSNTTNQRHTPLNVNPQQSALQLAVHKIVPPGIETIDAAAHLKLLGESLTIIGERLKQHEGQIAVSGSLSVLLDSLLCSMGPLLCLTKHIPGLEKRQQLKENLAATLDNIAYVMPGL